MELGYMNLSEKLYRSLMTKLNFMLNVDVTAQLKQESAVYWRILPAEGAHDLNMLTSS